jgi:hypothetical protein
LPLDFVAFIIAIRKSKLRLTINKNPLKIVFLKKMLAKTITSNARKDLIIGFFVQNKINWSINFSVPLRELKMQEIIIEKSL